MKANQQIEAQKLYKQELQASYKSVLADQMSQKRMAGEMAMREKQLYAQEYAKRQEFNKEREEAARMQKLNQQYEYRNVLDD